MTHFKIGYRKQAGSGVYRVAPTTKDLHFENPLRADQAPDVFLLFLVSCLNSKNKYNKLRRMMVDLVVCNLSHRLWAVERLISWSLLCRFD